MTLNQSISPLGPAKKPSTVTGLNTLIFLITKKARRLAGLLLLASFRSRRSRLFLRRGRRFCGLLRAGSFLRRGLLGLRLRLFGFLSLFGSLFLRSGFLRAAFLLGGRLLDLWLVADELEDGHLRSVATARSELDDARVTARALGEARTERVEQLSDQTIIADDALRPTAIVHAVILAQRHQTLDLRPELFRFRQRGDDALLIDERGELIAEERRTMRARSPQLSIRHSVSHNA